MCNTRGTCFIKLNESLPHAIQQQCISGNMYSATCLHCRHQVNSHLHNQSFQIIIYPWLIHFPVQQYFKCTQRGAYRIWGVLRRCTYVCMMFWNLTFTSPRCLSIYKTFYSSVLSSWRLLPIDLACSSALRFISRSSMLLSPSMPVFPPDFRNCKQMYTMD